MVNTIMFWVYGFSNDFVGFLCEHFEVHAETHISQTQEKLHMSSMAGGRSCLELLNCWIDWYPGFVAWESDVINSHLSDNGMEAFSSNMFSFHAAMAASRHCCHAAPFELECAGIAKLI